MSATDDEARAEAEALLGEAEYYGGYEHAAFDRDRLIATLAEGLRATEREASWKNVCHALAEDARSAKQRVAELEAALERIVAWYGDRDAGWHGDEPRAIARAALGGEGPSD